MNQFSGSGADDSLFVLMDGEAIGEILGSEARDYLADPLGSVRGHLDDAADLVASFDYWPYGESVSPASASDGPLLWLGTMGYYQDPGTRSYVRARSYDQNLGAWLQVDPLWPNEPGFGYVGGRPVTETDVLGLNGDLVVPRPRPFPRVPRLPGIGSGLEVGVSIGLIIVACVKGYQDVQERIDRIQLPKDSPCNKSRVAYWMRRQDTYCKEDTHGGCGGSLQAGYGQTVCEKIEAIIKIIDRCIEAREQVRHCWRGREKVKSNGEKFDHPGEIAARVRNKAKCWERWRKEKCGSVR